MPNSYVLLTDSASDLPQSVVEETGIEVLPLTFTLRGKDYLNYPDEREMRLTEFYAMMRAGEVVKTAAINLDRFQQTVRPLLEAGQDILYLAFSSALSATCNNARVAAEELSAQYPQRKIRIVDTLCASLGQGLLAYLTAKQRDAGASLDEAAKFAEDTKLRICHWFTVDDLVYLKRGGRVSAATALIGGALGIKPILHVDNEGRLIKMSTTRGRKNSIAALAEHMRQGAIDPASQTIFIVHGDCRADADLLASMLKSSCGFKEVIIGFNGPVIGAHSGPGTLAVFYLGRER